MCSSDLDAQEWYVRNVEHHDRVVREWTLESALIEMQINWSLVSHSF